MVKFAIRDDDTSFFSSPSELETVYADIYEKVPISLAIVPFHAGLSIKRIPKRFWDAQRLFPLADNHTLVYWLLDGLSNGHLAVMQHGYSHGDTYSNYEFRDGEDLDRKVREGRRHLEETLNTSVTAFVPPHNTFSRKGFIAVVDAGMHIVGIPSFRPSSRRIRLGDIIPYLRFKRFAIRFKGNPFQYPWPLSLTDHLEIACYGLIPGVTFELLKQCLDFARSANGVFCLATHYWELLESPELHLTLKRIVDYASALPDVRATTVPALFE